MPMFPDQAQLTQLEQKCLAIFQAGGKESAPEIAEQLMELPGLPMHSPYHHFLLAAALLTSAALRTEMEESQYCRKMAQAKERAAQVPGGYCGQFGCCGAAVSAGIFASVWQNSAPTKKTGWAEGNFITARALEHIASVEGPRCCKRVTWLALRGVLPAIQELLGLDLGEVGDHRCRFHDQNRECLGSACPFFPSDGI